MGILSAAASSASSLSRVVQSTEERFVSSRAPPARWTLLEVGRVSLSFPSSLSLWNKAVILPLPQFWPSKKIHSGGEEEDDRSLQDGQSPEDRPRREDSALEEWRQHRLSSLQAEFESGFSVSSPESLDANT